MRAARTEGPRPRPEPWCGAFVRRGGAPSPRPHRDRPGRRESFTPDRPSSRRIRDTHTPPPPGESSPDRAGTDDDRAAAARNGRGRAASAGEATGRTRTQPCRPSRSVKRVSATRASRPGRRAVSCSSAPKTGPADPSRRCAGRSRPPGPCGRVRPTRGRRGPPPPPRHRRARRQPCGSRRRPRRRSTGTGSSREPDARCRPRSPRPRCPSRTRRTAWRGRWSTEARRTRSDLPVPDVPPERPLARARSDSATPGQATRVRAPPGRFHHEAAGFPRGGPGSRPRVPGKRISHRKPA